MAVPAEYRKALREKLMGKGTSLVEAPTQAAPQVEEKAPFTYWKGSVRRNMSENLIPSPFKFPWGERSGMEVTNLLEDEVAPVKYTEKKVTLQEARTQTVSKAAPEGKVIPGKHKVL